MMSWLCIEVMLSWWHHTNVNEVNSPCYLTEFILKLFDTIDDLFLLVVTLNLIRWPSSLNWTWYSENGRICQKKSFYVKAFKNYCVNRQTDTQTELKTLPHLLLRSAINYVHVITICCIPTHGGQSERTKGSDRFLEHEMARLIFPWWTAALKY